MLDKIAAQIQTTIGLSVEIQIKMLISIVIILGLWLIRLAIMRSLGRWAPDARSAYTWRKTVSSVTVLIGLLVLLRVWVAGLERLATFLGLLTAGLAIALKDLLVNFVGWIFISWRKPFVVGDRIQVGEHAGDIIDLRIFQFTLLEIGNWVGHDQPTGRIIHIPNGKVFTEPQANYTKAFRYIWNEIPVLVTFESDWRKAKGILEDIARRHAGHVTDIARGSFQRAAQQFLISVSDLEPTVYTSVPDSGVLLTVRYLCDPHERRATEQTIWEDILKAFGACDDIDFAYATTRFYQNPAEGKRGTQPRRNSHEGEEEGTP